MILKPIQGFIITGLISVFCLATEVFTEVSTEVSKDWNLIHNSQLFNQGEILVHRQQPELRGFVHQEMAGLVENNNLNEKTDLECEKLKNKYKIQSKNKVDTIDRIDIQSEHIGSNKICQIEIRDSKNIKSQILYFEIKSYKNKKAFIAHTITFSYLNKFEKTYKPLINQIKAEVFTKGFAKEFKKSGRL